MLNRSNKVPLADSIDALNKSVLMNGTGKILPSRNRIIIMIVKIIFSLMPRIFPTILTSLGIIVFS